MGNGIIQPKNIVNLSGGKDSTTMLDIMLKWNMPVDAIHFADVGVDAEFAEMYPYIDMLEQRYGREIKRLKSSKHTFNSIFYGYPTRGKRTNEIRGFPMTLGSACRPRSWLKTDVLEAEAGKGNIIYIGFAADEQSRIQSSEYTKGHNTYRFLLDELKMTEADCLQYIKDEGIYNSLYNYFNRLGCYFCPKQPLSSLRSLFFFFPQHWSRIKQMEVDQGRPFKYGYTVPGLEEKFRHEYKTKGELMNQQELFSKDIDITLFNQLVNFICQVNKDPHNGNLNFSLFSSDMEFAPLQSIYGVHYPGAFLNTNDYAESLPKLRATALAFANAAGFLSADMFKTGEKENFVKKLKTLNSKNKDIYLTTALYFLTGEGKYLEAINHYTYEELPEILMALTVFQSSEALRDFFMTHIDLIGRLLTHDRSFYPFNNDGIYTYFIFRCGAMIQSLKPKNTIYCDFLKAIASLPFKRINAQINPKLYAVLTKHGYLPKDIAYLNHRINHLTFGDQQNNKKAIIQKIICDYVAVVLSDHKSQSKAEYRYLEQLIIRYKFKFTPRFDGFDNIIDYINNHLKTTPIGNRQTYLWLLNKKENDYWDIKHEHFQFNMLDKINERLIKALTGEQLGKIFHSMIETGVQPEVLSPAIEKVRLLKSYDFINTVKEGYEHKDFAYMVDTGLINLQEMLPDLSNLSDSLKYNVSHYLTTVPTKKAFNFIAAFHTQYGIENFTRFFSGGFTDIIRKRLSIYYSSRSSADTYADLYSDFLNPSETRVLIEIADAAVYHEKPKEHQDFVKEILLKEDIDKIFSNEELRALFDLIRPNLRPSEEARYFNLYLTEDERREINIQREQKKKQDEEVQYQKNRQEVFDDFKGGDVVIIAGKLSDYSRYPLTAKEEIAYEIALTAVKNRLEQKIKNSEEETRAAAKILHLLFAKNYMTLNDYLQQMENLAGLWKGAV